jgi:hypothetical protein
MFLITLCNVQYPDPYIEVVDSAPALDPKLDLSVIKNPQKISNLIIMTLKKQ